MGAHHYRKKRSDTVLDRQPLSPNKTRCVCGECRECLENAKWERIYEKKFKDPTYYTRDHGLITMSPLADI